MPKRLAIVGLGGWATSMHLPVCRRLQDEGKAVYCGVCDGDEERRRRAAALLDGKSYADLDTMLEAEKPDGLIVLVKPDMTPHLLQKSIKHRIPFLTEKPPSTSATVHQELIESIQRLPHVIGYNRRFTPYATTAMDWMRGQRIHTVEASFCRHRRLEADFTGTAVHGIDAALFLSCGQLAEIRLEAVRAETTRNLFMTAWTKENCRISLTIAPDSACSEEHYTVRSAFRSAKIEHPGGGKDAGRVLLFEMDTLQREISSRELGMADSDLPAISGILAEHQNFIDLLEGKRASLCTLQDTLNTAVIRDAFRAFPVDADRNNREISFR